MIKQCISGFMIVFLSVAYANNHDSLKDSLAKVQASITQDVVSQPGNDAQNMRDTAIRQAAIVYGAQSGRYYRWQQMETLLHKRHRLLDRIFDFGSMYLDDGLIQPPVLDMSSNVTHISNSGQVRELIHNVYRVLIPASFKSRPITWQSFLLVDSLSKPMNPRAALLPRNDHEKVLWHESIEKGWIKGIEEANGEFSTRLSSLNNAYQGMALYTLLAMKGMVSAPHVVKSSKDVESSTDGQKMAVGIHEQIIAKKSYLISEPNHWQPVVYHANFRMRGDQI